VSDPGLNRSDKEAVGGCIAVLVGLAALPFALAWQGFVLSLLWAWYVVPAFSAPALSWPLVAGLLVIKNTALVKATAKDEGDAVETIARAVAWGFLSPAIGLALGATFRLFL
jgi:hypothetical protein